MLKIENVSKVYKKKEILRDVSFEIRSGEILGLVGESGCGKSTLARLIGRFEKPTGGEIWYQNQNIVGLKGTALRKFRKDCQMIFQDNFSSLDPAMRIRSSLEEPINNNFRKTPQEKKTQIQDMMRQVKLEETVLPRIPAAISGGERQRVNICRALMMSPSLLICDEITSSLDVITQAKLLELLKWLNHTMNRTIFFISHDIDAVKSICHRVMVMNDGKIVEVLDGASGFKHEHPYTETLFHALPVHHPSLRV